MGEDGDFLGADEVVSLAFRLEAGGELIGGGAFGVGEGGDSSAADIADMPDDLESPGRPGLLAVCRFAGGSRGGFLR